MTADHLFDLRDFIAARHDAVTEVRAVEVSDEDERLAQPQLGADVLAHLRGRRRGVAVNGGAGEPVAQLAQLPVLGTEVVTPVADAVRFIDRERAHVHAAEQRAERRRRQALGRDEEQAQRAVERTGFDRALLVRRGRAVQRRRGHAGRDERVDLVLHQRDERRDDDGQSVEEQRRRLEAERLSRAGGHDQERVAPGEHGVDGLPLQRAQRGEPPRARDDVEHGIRDFSDHRHRDDRTSAETVWSGGASAHRALATDLPRARWAEAG
jgi:hypothetical protein